MDKFAFGKRLNNVRKEKKITSESLSELCDITAVFVRNIECGSKLPSLPTFVKLCNALQVSPDYLLADSLEIYEGNQIDNLVERLKTLTPKQLDIVTSTIETMISKLRE